jgi:hypothetical protein
MHSVYKRALGHCTANVARVSTVRDKVHYRSRVKYRSATEPDEDWTIGDLAIEEQSHRQATMMAMISRIQ